MSSRILSFSGGVASYSSHQSSIATSRPRFISCCRAVTYGVRTRRGLINTTSPPERPPSDNDKDATSSSPSDSLIKVTDIPAPHTGHIRVITLNSPRNKNAISRQLLGELEAEIQGIHNVIRDEVQAWQNKVPGAGIGQGTRAIVVGSEVDGVFCAGADLKERKDMTTEETQDFLDRLRQMLRMIYKLRIPSISAISSVALGGGLELGLATHFRVFSPATVVGLPETRLGIIPGAGGTYRLRNVVGKTRALDLVLTGRRVRGDEALSMGLCNRLAGPSLQNIEASGLQDDYLRHQVLQDAVKMATEICEGGPATILPAMCMVEAGNAGTEDYQYQKVLATEDRNQALRAFAEKRKPVFTGR